MQRIINIHAPCYKVMGYDLEDIKQEAFIIALKIYEKWDGERPFEHFLSFSLSNRLKTFVRDKHKLQGPYSDSNMRVLSPIGIDTVDWDTEKALIEIDMVSEETEYNDLISKIDEYLPVTLRRDYLQMKDGVKISKKRREEIRFFISNLIKELKGDNDE